MGSMQWNLNKDIKMLGYRSFVLLPFLLFSFSQLSNAVDYEDDSFIWCPEDWSMEKVTIRSKENYWFGGEFYEGQKANCIAKFKLDETCDSAIIQCDEFETKCRKDKLFFKVHRQPKKIMCGTEKPYMEVDKKDKKFVMKFIKRNRKTYASMFCSVRCSDADQGFSTDFPIFPTTTEKTDEDEEEKPDEDEDEKPDEDEEEKPEIKDCKCGLAKRTKRIVGGKETEVNEYPWQILMYKNGWQHCGGSIISDRWIMTAAHCVVDKRPSIYKIVLGEHDMKDGKETDSMSVGVEKIISHNKYNSRKINYDFALMKLKKDIDFKKHPHMRPICLPNANAGDFAGEKAIVSGWGATSEGGDVSNVLLEAEVNVMSNKECVSNTNYGSNDITDVMMCAGIMKGGTDSCQGDSGGPLISSSGKDGVTPGQNYELIGVVSWGYGCAAPRAPGVYARVTEIIGWIDEKAGDLKTCRKQ